ncbi:MAG: antibiotic biosynthesis monooxygenase [Calothrix sp. FI2-JRJ7]|jgi:quinol monooxygenase YgiN|nr:antibiotic biosynthesis monooxygenase [Calothrix sp. FI2-JRJ7]
MTLRVVARVVTLPGKESQFKALALPLVEATRLETGCIKYELLQNLNDPTDFTFVEEWTNDAALNLHLQAPHFVEAAGKLDGLVAMAPDIRRYEVIF